MSNQSQVKKKKPISPHVVTGLVIVTLVAVTLVMFAKVLFATGDITISQPHGDLAFHYAHLRQFGFEELRKGNLPLWNPYNFSGMPFVGFFQSAMFYPPNMVHLILPLAAAINWTVALHIFLSGLFVCLWSRRHGFHPAASLLAGFLWMFSGPLFMHVYAGHLTLLCTMAWAPMIMLCIDEMLKKPCGTWALLGGLVVAMQVLAGFPQCFFYTAVAGLIYFCLRIANASMRARALIGFAVIYAMGVAMSSVQLITGIEAAGESVRAGGTTFKYAATFSFPPENFITLLVPGFFGNMTNFPYWGRCFLWEMCLFIGVTGFFLAIYGTIAGDRPTCRFWLCMVIILLILALGAHTPLFAPLYRYVPGFNCFRGMSKFILPASLFLCMLAGAGFDTMLKNKKPSRGLLLIVLGTAICLGTGALCIKYMSARDEGLWSRLMKAMYELKECYADLLGYTSPSFFHEAGVFASKSLLVSSGICLFLFMLLLLARHFKVAVYAVGVLAAAEVIVFSSGLRATFDAGIENRSLRRFLDSNPGDYRIMYPFNPNHAMCMRIQDVWGYEALVLKRYAAFMAFTQGKDPNTACAELSMRRYHRLMSLLRLRFIFVPEGNAVKIMEPPSYMPHVCLVPETRVVKGAEEVFEVMGKPDFDPRKVVVLESPSHLVLGKSRALGTARLLDFTTDHMTIEAGVAEPAILLVTDAYSKGWRAIPLEGSTQTRYEVMPADYAFMAIPLSAGYHKIRLEYMPTGFIVGKWISIASAVVYLILVIGVLIRERRKTFANPE